MAKGKPSRRRDYDSRMSRESRERMAHIFKMNLLALGRSQSALARDLGISPSAVSLTLSGATAPRTRADVKRWIEELHITGAQRSEVYSLYDGDPAEIATREDVKRTAAELISSIESQREEINELRRGLSTTEQLILNAIATTTNPIGVRSGPEEPPRLDPADVAVMPSDAIRAQLQSLQRWYFPSASEVQLQRALDRLSDVARREHLSQLANLRLSQPLAAIDQRRIVEVARSLAPVLTIEDEVTRVLKKLAEPSTPSPRALRVGNVGADPISLRLRESLQASAGIEATAVRDWIHIQLSLRNNHPLDRYSALVGITVEWLPRMPLREILYAAIGFAERYFYALLPNAEWRLSDSEKRALSIAFGEKYPEQIQKLLLWSIELTWEMEAFGEPLINTTKLSQATLRDYWASSLDRVEHDKHIALLTDPSLDKAYAALMERNVIRRISKLDMEEMASLIRFLLSDGDELSEFRGFLPDDPSLDALISETERTRDAFLRLVERSTDPSRFVDTAKLMARISVERFKNFADVVRDMANPQEIVDLQGKTLDDI